MSATDDGDLETWTVQELKQYIYKLIEDYETEIHKHEKTRLREIKLVKEMEAIKLELALAKKVVAAEISPPSQKK